MKNKFLLVFMAVCILCSFCACQDTTPAGNDLTSASPTPTAEATQPASDAKTPDNTETTTVTEGTQTATSTATAKPSATATKTAGNKPTATSANNTTKKPTQTATTTPGGYKQPYILYVNRQENVVTVYKADNKGNATTPVKAMLCSTGRDNGTPTGTFSISNKYTWRPLYGNVYGQYACRFNGSILFHSVPYLKTNKGTLKPGEFNKLGTQASDGCVRLAIEDCKWIYDNCDSGTKVVVYDSSNPGPLGKPSGIMIPEDSGWDPTDPDAKNPWKKANPTMPITFSGISDTPIELQRNSKLSDLYAGIKARDAKGKDVTDYITITSNTVDTEKLGNYSVTYKVTNLSTGAYQTVTAHYQVVDKTAPVIHDLVKKYEIAADEVSKMTRERLLKGVTVSDDGEEQDTNTIVLTVDGKTYTPELLVAGKKNTVLLQVKDKNGNEAEVSIVIDVKPEPTPEHTETPPATETPGVTDLSTPTQQVTPTNS